MTADDPYMAARVRAAIIDDAAELGVEVSWRGERLVVRGHLDAEACAAVIDAARAAAAPIEVIDELEHVLLGSTHGRPAERIKR